MQALQAHTHPFVTHVWLWISLYCVKTQEIESILIYTSNWTLPCTVKRAAADTTPIYTFERNTVNLCIVCHLWQKNGKYCPTPNTQGSNTRFVNKALAHSLTILIIFTYIWYYNRSVCVCSGAGKGTCCVFRCDNFDISTHKNNSGHWSPSMRHRCVISIRKI